MARQIRINLPGSESPFLPQAPPGSGLTTEDGTGLVTEDGFQLVPESSSGSSSTIFSASASSQGDFFIDSSGRLVIIDDTDSIQQSIIRRLQTSQGEYRHNLLYGVPFLQRIAGKQSNLEIVRAIYAETILETPGVSDILELGLELGSDRTLTISGRVRLDNNTDVTFSPVEIRINN